MSTDVWDEVSESTEDRVPRDRWGRPMVITPQGGKPTAYTRVTTFAGSVEDMYGLGQWQQRMVALGLAKRSDLLLSVSAHAEDKDELNRIAEQAKEAAAASAAANTGIAVHKLAERHDRGQLALADVPESHRPDLQAYVAAMGGLTIHGIEEFVVLDDLKVAGTFDRVVEYDGQRYVGDIKTGSIEYGAGKMAIQLALYSRGRLYQPGKAERADIGVSQTAGLIIHLPAGQGVCNLYWIDLRAGWEAVELCERVRAWRKRKGLLAAASFGTAVLAPEAERECVACGGPVDGTARACVGCLADAEGGVPLPGSKERLAAKAAAPELALDHPDRGRDLGSITAGCPECIDVGADEDPAPWCDCRPDETCKGPCRRRAHAPEHCPNPWMRCGRCNAGGHTCPGCGESVPHGTVACTACSATSSAPAAEVKPAPKKRTPKPKAEPPIEPAPLGIVDLIKTFNATIVTIDDQIGNATSPEELERVWSENRDEWTAEHTRLAGARKKHLHQRSLRAVVPVS